MAKATQILIAFLTLLVISVLLLATFFTFIPLANSTCLQEAYQKLNLLPAMAISSGVLIAILSFSRDRKKWS